MKLEILSYNSLIESSKSGETLRIHLSKIFSSENGKWIKCKFSCIIKTYRNWNSCEAGIVRQDIRDPITNNKDFMKMDIDVNKNIFTKNIIYWFNIYSSI